VIRLTLEILHHTLTHPDLEDDDLEEEDDVQHDVALDSLVERADHRDANPAAELDTRTRMGFK
jgi:peptidoglycan/xylan/chitin deacetylase (PgdA/CDA1 family)